MAGRTGGENVGFGFVSGGAPEFYPPGLATWGERDVFRDDLVETLSFANVTKEKSPAAVRPSPSGTVSSYTTGQNNDVLDSQEYNIKIEFKGTWDPALQQVLIATANEITSIIKGELSNVSVVGLKGKPVNVDDLVITAELSAIDGDGGVLGQAGPTSLRTGSYLPATATMQFDSADAKTYFNLGFWDEIITHEMLHCVGFGSIWDYLDLTTGTLYNSGTAAYAEYQALLTEYRSDGHSVPTTWSTSGIPLEDGGGSGTAGSHWEESIFQDELMTGYLDDGAPLSAMSIAALQDLGYKLSGAGADAYSIPIV